MQQCLFCRIARKEIPADIVWESETILAFRDIAPVAPTHILIIPKIHIPSLNEADDPQLLGQILMAAKEIARQEKIDGEGYRIVNNIGENGGQSVGHLHFHLLGGRRIGWPPG